MDKRTNVHTDKRGMSEAPHLYSHTGSLKAALEQLHESKKLSFMPGLDYFGASNRIAAIFVHFISKSTFVDASL